MIYRVILLLLLCPSSYAQSFNASEFLGIGNTGIALKSVYSISNNAAGLIDLKATTVGIAYQPHFLSTDLSTQALYLAIPIKKKSAFGLSMNNYGITGASSLLTITGAYMRSFADYFSTSISINYHSFSIKNYGRDQTFSVDLGAHVSIMDNLAIGAVFRNISTEMFEEDIDQYLPREIGIGAKYDLSKDLFLSSDIYYDSFQKIAVRAGASYNIAKVIILRAGASSRPTQYYAGLGIHVKQVKIDLASSFHPQLGSSPQIAVNYEF